MAVPARAPTTFRSRDDQAGVPVFNAPGANANAVKELVLAGCCSPRATSRGAGLRARPQGADKAINEAVEAGKKKFVGYELPGRTLGVIGLGAIGVKSPTRRTSSAWRAGFRPGHDGAERVAAVVRRRQALSLDDLFARSDMITVHVPLMDATRGLVNAERLQLMRNGGVILNFAREASSTKRRSWTPSAAASSTLRLRLPDSALKDHAEVVALPHLGASTSEAEDNCAMMVADTLRDFLEHGNIRNSVNFPEAVLPRPATDAAGDRQRERAEHGRPDLDRTGRGQPQHRRPAQQVAGRARLHAGGHRRQRARIGPG